MTWKTDEKIPQLKEKIHGKILELGRENEGSYETGQIEHKLTKDQVVTILTNMEFPCISYGLGS